MKRPSLLIYTIGHSTHPIGEFIALLKVYGIQQLIDVRTIAKSRHNPQFNQADLRKALKNRSIAYRHMKGLGGLRHAHKDSINTAWHNLSFRGYADYMQTPAFKENLERLIEYAKKKQVAIMCSEAVPWRCHRSLIGDALTIRGITVKDIFSKTNCRTHTVTPWANVHGLTITYPS